MNIQTSLEEKLKSRIKKIKCITLIAAMAFMILCILFFALREKTKTVTVIESPIPVIPDHTSVVYSTSYSLLAGVCLILTVLAFTFLLTESIFTKVCTVEACGSTIIFYQAFTASLYVDGEKVDRMFHYWEAPLANGATVTVSLSRNALFAHMSFSNGHPSIDL